MDELRRKLAASEENGTKPREYVLRLETKITQQFKKLVYCKYNTTAKFTADAPQGRAYELLRAAISGGHTKNVACKEDVVKWQQQAAVSFSLERASMRALDVLRGSADERLSTGCVGKDKRFAETGTLGVQ